MTEHTSLVLAAIGLLALAAQWAAWRLRLPAILFLLLGGFVAGPLGGWLDPDALFGDLLFPFVSLAVAVILFEGSLTLRFEEIRGLTRVVRNLVTVGLLVTWGVTTVAAHFLVGFTWDLAALFGAITVVTGPTVIGPMLRVVLPKQRLAHILRWEGIVIDPVGAMLAVLVFEFIVAGHGQSALAATLEAFALLVSVGVAVGLAAGWLWGSVLRRHLLPDYLRSPATLFLVFAVFALANALQEESGLLAVTLMGLWLANRPGIDVEDILDFKEHLSLVLISGLFIILAARVQGDQLIGLGWTALLVFLAIQFVARPLKVLVSTWGSDLSWRERALLAWIAPRGIVAAAVSALFAMRLEALGFPGAADLVPLTFLVILGTVVLQSLTARPVGKLLGVVEPEADGVLIVGANAVARAVAQALVQAGKRVQLADSSWEAVSAARMAGLPVYFGNPVSEHAERHLDLTGLGRLLALSPNDELNALATVAYAHEFGRAHVYSLPPREAKGGDRRVARVSAEREGLTLFSKEATYARLASLLGQGGQVKATALTETFTWEDYRKQHPQAIPLFAVDDKGRVRFFTAEAPLKPGPGWQVFALHPPAEGAPEAS